MVANIRCDNCGLLFAIPGGAQAPWVACPRCGENNFNPDVIRRGGDTGVNWTGFLGTMLMLGAIFGWCSRSVAIGLEHWPMKKQVARDPPVEIMVILQTLAFLCLFVAGVLLVRTNERRETRRLKLIGASVATLGALTLLMLSGVIFLFFPCFIRL